MSTRELIAEASTVTEAVSISERRPPSRRRRRNWSAVLNYGITVVVVLAIWQLIVWVLKPNQLILPTPVQVFADFGESGRLLFANLWPTLIEGGVGFLMSLAVAIPLGTLLSRPYRWCRALEPLLLMLQVFPKIAVAPLFLVWFGLGLFPIVLFVFLLTFFPILQNTLDGYRSVPKDLRDLGAVVGMSGWRRLRSIELPYALPQIFTGMKVSASFALTAALVYEFIGANSGLGFVTFTAQINFATPTMFAALILVAVLGFLFYGLISLIEALLVPWHISQRSKK